MRRLIVIASLTAVLAACSTDVNVEPDGRGLCVQERSRDFLGVTISRDRNIVTCGTP